MMSALFQDLRYAARSLRKAPAFTALAVICLAIGIGLNTTIFSVVNATLLRSFDFRKPAELVEINDRHVKSGPRAFAGISYPDYLDLKQRATSFSGMAAVTGKSLTLSDGEEPERYLGAPVSWNLFPMLGVKPILGRTFRADEDRLGAPGAILLSYDVWQRRYHGDPSIVGRAIPVNGKPCTVVGVMPKRFAFPERHRLWIPLAPENGKDSRSARSLQVFARLGSGVPVARARAELRTIAGRIAQEHPAEDQGFITVARTLRELYVPDEVRLVLLAMMGAVTCVLLVACANVANLLLARASSRHREIAIRSAIGAGRGRIVRQLLTESVLIALLGGLFGVLIATWGLDLITASMPPDDIPYVIHWSIDGASLVYTLVVSVLTGILFGMAPAVQTASSNLQEALKEGSRGTGAGGRRVGVRNALVVAEVALSLVLLVTAALFVRSFFALQRVQPGFDVAKLMTMRLYLPGTPYDSDAVKRERLEEVLRRIESLPGVEAATASNTIAFDGGGDADGIIAEGSKAPVAEAPLLPFTGVTAHWFRTHGVPILRGRDLTPAEASDSAAVAVVTVSFGKRLWGGEDPLGKRFRLRSAPGARWITVVGVVSDMQLESINTTEPSRWAFLPYLYVPARNNGITIRVAGDPATITNAARRAIRAADPALPVFGVMTMEEQRRTSFWQYRLFGWMFSIFGAIALVLALVGVYGVVSYGVGQRTHEIGVRMALGARSEDVLRMVVGQGARLATLGIALGLLGGLGAGRAVQSLLRGTGPGDPLSFASIAALLTGTALLASYVPARRAAEVDPMVALREE